MKSHDDKYQRGLEILTAVAGTRHPKVLNDLDGVASDLGRYLVEFVYGEVYSRPGLSLRQQELAAVAGLAALGNAQPQLRFHTQGALNAGCTPEEIDRAVSSHGGDVDSEIAAVAAATACGTSGRSSLVAHIQALLAAGGTREQVVETILLMAVFAGFPAALNGLDAAREALTKVEPLGSLPARPGPRR